MELTELCSLLMTPQRVEALKAVVTDKKVKRIKFDGLVGSSLAVVFSRLPKRVTPYLVVANDADEAGYMFFVADSTFWKKTTKDIFYINGIYCKQQLSLLQYSVNSKN